MTRVEELVEGSLKDLVEIVLVGTCLLTSKLLTKEAAEKVIQLWVISSESISTVNLNRNGLHI